VEAAASTGRRRRRRSRLHPNEIRFPRTAAPLAAVPLAAVPLAAAPLATLLRRLPGASAPSRRFPASSDSPSPGCWPPILSRARFDSAVAVERREMAIPV